MSFEGTLYEKKKARWHYLQRIEHIPRAEAQRQTEDWVRRQGANGLRGWEREREREYLNQLKEKTGVFCLSEVNNQMRMWEEYASNHSGICIELKPATAFPEVYTHFDFFGRILPVEYQDGPAVVSSYRKSLDENVRLAVRTKSRKWEYEQEWRYVDRRRGPGVRKLPPGLLTAVIVGCRISPDDLRIVKELIGASGRSIRLCQAIMTPAEDGLSIEPVK
jgi:hypothetical protein